MISLEDVKNYTKNGIIVHPIQAPKLDDPSTGKRPIVKDWQSRTTPYDVNEMEKFLNNRCNIGANCGKPSNLTVIDIDEHIKGVQEFIFNGYDVSQFCIQQRDGAQNGKKHILFLYNDKIKNNTHQELGFDIRNDGGNIVLAPSRHFTWTEYRLLSPIEDRTELPDKVATRINYVIDLYSEFTKILGLCRPSFSGLWKAVFSDKKSPLYHDKTVFRTADGRNRQLNFCAELKVNGASDEILHLTCWLIFGDSYDSKKTLDNLKHIKPLPAKNETLKNDQYYGQFFSENSVNFSKNKTTKNRSEEKERVPKKSEQIWAVADELAKLDIIAMAETGTLFLYNEGVYTSKNTEPRIQSMAAAIGLKLFDSCFLERDIENVLFRLKYLKSYPLNAFNKNPNIIVVENGLLDIETGELREHTPFEIYTNKFNFLYDPEAPLTPEFQNYLNSTFKDVEYQIDIIQEFFGYCLCNHYRFAVFLLLLGEGGNGKGVLENILISFIGEENTSGLALHEICSTDKFTLADMFEKKLNVCGDIAKTKIPNTENLKKLTGRNLIRAQFKYGQPFTFYNTAKIINSCNEMPKITDETKGFFDRLLIIDFPNSFRDTENDNKNLEAECTTPESLSGILTWAVQGYQRLMKQGKFNHSKSLEQKIEQYQKIVDPLEFYIERRIIENIGGFIYKDLIFKDYNKFASENKLKIFRENEFKNKFPKACIDYGLFTRPSRIWNNSYTERFSVFTDIGIKPNIVITSQEENRDSVGLAKHFDVHPDCLPAKKLDLT